MKPVLNKVPFYASIDRQLRKVMMAVKMRRSSHSLDMFPRLDIE